MIQQINPGDVVRLKDGSGPRAMTVEKEFNSRVVYIIWFDEDNYLHRQLVGKATLEIIKS